jgi:hypothetical protein
MRLIDADARCAELGAAAMRSRFVTVVTPRSSGLREMLVVVVIAAVGVLFAAVVALGRCVPEVGHPPVVRFHPPAVAAPHS